MSRRRFFGVWASMRQAALADGSTKVGEVATDGSQTWNHPPFFRQISPEKSDHDQGTNNNSSLGNQTWQWKSRQSDDFLSYLHGWGFPSCLILGPESWDATGGVEDEPEAEAGAEAGSECKRRPFPAGKSWNCWWIPTNLVDSNKIETLTYQSGLGLYVFQYTQIIGQPHGNRPFLLDFLSSPAFSNATLGCSLQESPVCAAREFLLDSVYKIAPWTAGRGSFVSGANKSSKRLQSQKKSTCRGRWKWPNGTYSSKDLLVIWQNYLNWRNKNHEKSDGFHTASKNHKNQEVKAQQLLVTIETYGHFPLHRYVSVVSSTGPRSCRVFGRFWTWRSWKAVNGGSPMTHGWLGEIPIGSWIIWR